MGEKKLKKNQELRQLRLDTVLVEYQSLRAELLQRFNHHIQIYSIIVTAMTFMFGWIIAQKEYDVLLIVPIFTSALGLRYIWDQNLIVMIGSYIQELEKDVIPKLLSAKGDESSSESRVINWEHYFKKNYPKFALYKPAIITLITILPIVPVLVFSISNLLPYLINSNEIAPSNLHPAIHIVAIVLYSIIGIYLSRKLWKS